MSIQLATIIFEHIYSVIVVVMCVMQRNTKHSVSSTNLYIYSTHNTCWLIILEEPTKDMAAVMSITYVV